MLPGVFLQGRVVLIANHSSTALNDNPVLLILTLKAVGK